MSRFVLTAQLQLQAPTNVRQIVQQIQSQLNAVNVNVQVQNAPQAQRQLQQVTQQCNQATTAAERMGKAFALSIRRFAAFSIATRAVGLFTSTLNDAIQSSINFERELIKVSQVTGKSVGQLRGLTKQITSLSTGLGVASSDLLATSTVLAQAGLNAEDTATALRTLAKAALAPNFDSISETAEGAIAILAQFQQGVGALEAQLGSINAVAGAFAVEAGDLIDVVRRTGGVFKSSGGNLNELLALFTSVRATTRESAESIGTGLRTIFTRIQRPKTIEYLKQFGVELLDLNGKFVGPYEAVKRLSEALSGLGEGDVTFIRIAEELGGFRQIGKVLPLLQQFSTAQSALNVAMKAGDSLTQDAASAQAALAIRIMKVREEFLALIRSVTETSTFQVMANTALSLASALIKIGDSIKPLLPMLAALAAFKIAKGLGGFFGGMMSGATSGRNYNKGGKVMAFARGGLVPGSGNRDTVPAMLSPGEFVIRKSSVNKMGAGTLAAMNNNRYAMGGTVGAIALNPTGSQSTGKGTVTIKDILATLSNNNQLAGGISGNLKLTDKSGKLQNLMDRKEAPDGLTFGNRLEKIVSRIAFGGKNRQTFTTKGVSFPSTKNSDSSIEQGIKTSLTNAYTNIIPSVSSQLASSVGLPTAIGAFNQNVIKSIGLEDATGKIFEAAVSSLGAPFDANKGKQDRDAFDFPMGIGSHLGQFKAFSELSDKPTDAKKTLDSSILNDIASRKTMNTLAEQVNTSGAFQALKKRVLSMEGTSKGRSEFDKPRGPRKKFFGGLIQRFAGGGEVLQRGMDKYLISDVVKGMRELQGNASLSEKDAIALFNSKNSMGDFVYTNFGGSGSKKLPKWLGTYKAPPSASMQKFLSNNATLDANLNRPESYRGARASGRYRRYALGGVARDPKNTLQNFFEGNSLYSSDRKETANKIRDMRSLRSAAPQILYSSISRNAFDLMAAQTGLNKNPKIPEGTKLFDREKYYDQEAKKIIGRTFKLSGFLSTSKEFNKAKMFLDNAARSEDNWAAMMTIMTKKNAMGVDVEKQLSGRKVGGSKQALNPRTGKMETFYQKSPESESEFTLQPGSRFKVNSSKLVDMMGRKNLWMDVQQFAKGGGVGTDTVPALLTPGEFVVNRKSAQGIGYGALNRMNKVGKYAKGGIVQNFAGGSTGTGVKSSGSGVSFPGLDPKVPSLISRAAEVLTGAFTSQTQTMRQMEKMWVLMANNSNALVGALSENVAANNYSVKQQSVLVKAYGTTIQSMLNMGYTDKQIQSKSMEFIAALDADTTAKKASAAATTATTATPKTPTVVSASTTIPAVKPSTTSLLGKAKDFAQTNLPTFSGALGLGPTVPTSPVATPTSSSVKASARSGANNSAIEQEITNLSKGIKVSTTRINAYNPTINQLTKSNEGLYQQSKQIDVKLNKYNQQIAYLNSVKQRSAAQEEAFQRLQSKAVALSTQQIDIDNKALAQEQQLTNVKKQQQSLIEEKNKQLAQKDNLANQARQNKQAATSAVTSTLQGGTQSSAAAVNTKGRDIVRQNRKDAARSASSFGGMGGGAKDIGGAAIAISMVTGSLQAMLPPLDENSSAITKVSHSFLGLVTTVAGVAFALQAFGVNLKAQSVMKFLGGGGIGGNGVQSVFNGVKNMGGSTNLAGKIAGTTDAIAKFAGPVLLAGAAAFAGAKAFQSLYDSVYDFDGRLQDAIKGGDVEKAKSVAAEKSGLSNKVARGAGTFGSAVAGGALVGSILPVIGTTFGATVGAVVGGLMVLYDSIGDSSAQQIALAASQAGAIKTQKALDEAQKIATSSMNDFNNGTISASDALSKIRASTGEVKNQQQRATDVAIANSENKSATGWTSARNWAANLGGGLFGMETSATRNKRLSKDSVEQINNAAKQQQEAFNIESPARQAAIRSGVSRGKDINTVRSEATNGLQQQISQQRLLGNQLQSSGDEAGAKAAFAAAEQMEGQLKQVNQEIANIEKEVINAKKSFEAMNLGLRSATATASALSASMDHFSAGLEVGGSTFVSDVEFLQQSLSSAAQAMDPNEIKGAVQSVSDNLRQFGSSEQYIQKFEGNIMAFTQAQANYNKAFDNIKQSMADADFKNLSSTKLKEKFAEELTKGMGPDVSDEAKKNLKDVIQGIELSTEDVDKIMAGDLSVFGDKLSEAQKKMLEDVQKIAQERAKAEQVLIDFTKKRIDAERNLVQAQQEALDLTLEGREVQSKYGGKAVSFQEKRANVLGKSNVESQRLGLTSMKTGSIEELRARNAELKTNFGDIEGRRTIKGGMSNKEGVSADEAQKDLQKAYKTQIDTIRSLIKLEEEQLKITQEKNKLEKESMESLIKGDVEEFFKKQSAVGATAAIASGDTRLQNYYGADALGMAYQDIQRQQEAGVQSLYGQQLGGVGGLTEAAAGAALSSRGVTDMRAAQVMAGTTAEEEASKSRLRELGGMLGETGELGVDMAEMQVNTSVVNLTAAQVKFDDVMKRGNEKAEEAQRTEGRTAAQSLNRGGVVYANRGIFVPRGTDTVPAMLTPGEFVINRSAVNRGNNLQILQAMNNGSNVSSSSVNNGTAMMSGGGKVRYYAEGDQVSGGGGMFGNMSNFVTALTQFGSSLAESITKLSQTNISIKLDSTAVNINLNDGGLLKALTGQVKTELFKMIESEFKVDNGGRLKRNSAVIGN